MLKRDKSIHEIELFIDLSGEPNAPSIKCKASLCGKANKEIAMAKSVKNNNFRKFFRYLEKNFEYLYFFRVQQGVLLLAQLAVGKA